MIIKNLSCKQFAGISNRNIDFAKGMNVMVGPNETGKSTMADLIYHILFQDAKVKKNDKFVNSYFPQTTAEYQPDRIDGKMEFETEDGTYELEKKWSAANKDDCTLETPDGNIYSNNDTVNKILADKLVYGKGVYDEMVFASQKRAMTVLQALFQDSAARKRTDTLGNVKQELSSTVSKAVMETGGISIDKLQQCLNDILEQYGEKWNFGMDMPDGGRSRGIHNKWDCAKTAKALKENKAIILRAYYDMEETAEKQRKEKDAEKEYESALGKLESAKAEKKKLKALMERFISFRDAINRRELDKARRESLKGMKRDAESWKDASDKSAKAEALKSLLHMAECKELFELVKGIDEDILADKNRLSEIGPIDGADVSTADRLEREIEIAETKLQGLNLIAKITQLGDIAPEIKSAVDGRKIELTDGEINITEAISITVPGVIEMQLTPADVDAESISKELAAKRNTYTGIINKYKASDLEKLRENYEESLDLNKEISNKKKLREQKLEGIDYESLKQEYYSLPDNVISIPEVKGKISELCGSISLEAFAGKHSGTVEGLTEKYGNPENLNKKVSDLDKELSSGGDAKTEEKIPEEFLTITDTERYYNNLNDRITELDECIDKKLQKELNDKENALGEMSAEEYQELLKQKTDLFNAQKDVYFRWKHISDVVNQIKDTSEGNGTADIEEKFREYLSVITSGEMKLGALDSNLDAAMSSGKNRLSYENLSEGSKETIALAFRLAMLEHLFPDGNGLAVFDDPFTDMDPDRTKEACRLIQKFAENNQVIFITCDPKYTEMLNGNVIETSK